MWSWRGRRRSDRPLRLDELRAINTGPDGDQRHSHIFDLRIASGQLMPPVFVCGFKNIGIHILMKFSLAGNTVALDGGMNALDVLPYLFVSLFLGGPNFAWPCDLGVITHRWPFASRTLGFAPHPQTVIVRRSPPGIPAI